MAWLLNPTMRFLDVSHLTNLVLEPVRDSGSFLAAGHELSNVRKDDLGTSTEGTYSQLVPTLQSTITPFSVKIIRWFAFLQQGIFLNVNK
jgi:hypothetical protein